MRTGYDTPCPARYAHVVCISFKKQSLPRRGPFFDRIDHLAVHKSMNKAGKPSCLLLRLSRGRAYGASYHSPTMVYRSLLAGRMIVGTKLPLRRQTVSPACIDPGPSPKYFSFVTKRHRSPSFTSTVLGTGASTIPARTSASSAGVVGGIPGTPFGSLLSLLSGFPAK